MGLPRNTLEFITDNMLDMCDVKTGHRMLELGNQIIRNNSCTAHKTGKAFFEAMGYDHTSIDSNGKDGALAENLNFPIVGIGEFDVITNSGTSGYVENQDACFRNIDNLCKVGGRMIHIVPEVGSDWAGKQYSADFFVKLADEYNYTIVKNETMDGQYGLLRCVVLVKNEKDLMDS